MLNAVGSILNRDEMVTRGTYTRAVAVIIDENTARIVRRNRPRITLLQNRATWLTLPHVLDHTNMHDYYEAPSYIRRPVFSTRLLSFLL